MKPKLLLVDDNPGILESFSLYLMMEGFEVIACKNGSEAIDWIWENEKPSLILTDLDMPIYNGLDVIRQAKERYGEVKTILMSGGFLDQSEEECRAVASDVIPKPFLMSELLDKIGSLVGKNMHRQAVTA